LTLIYSKIDIIEIPQISNKLPSPQEPRSFSPAPAVKSITPDYGAPGERLEVQITGSGFQGVVASIR
jgi:hypothetical protein